MDALKGTESVSVDYQISVDDYAEAHRYIFANTPAGKRLFARRYLWNAVILIFIAGILALVMCLIEVPASVPILYMLAVGLYALFGLKRSLMRSALKYARRHIGEYNKGLLLPTNITIDSEGARGRNELGEGRDSWEAFEALAEDASYIYLFFAAFRFYVIPKKCFATPGDASAFFAAARAWHSAATDKGNA